MRRLAATVAVACAGSLLLDPAQAVAAEPEAEQIAAHLAGLGCFVGRTATEGDRFTAALIRFQSANDLRQTGEPNRRTLRRLASEDALRCDDRPVPKRSGEGRRIVLSQGQNWLWLVRADGTVAGQGGIVDNDWLPQRTYSTGDQCGRPGRARYRVSEDYSLQIDYFVRFYCRVGFHQIPVSKATGRQLHERFYAGTDLRKSHGCLRVPYPLVKKLWRFTKKRTEVVVTG